MVDSRKKYLFASEWLSIYQDLAMKGKVVSPRGQRILEIENYAFKLSPYNRFANFGERKLSIKYLAAEFLWYLNGDRNDESIIRVAKFWEQIKNQNPPYFHSNYGYYIFRERQFEHCYQALIADRDTRQACIIINNAQVMMSNSKDKICTYALSFRIREGRLNMTVRMRSNDFILGTQNDVFQFSIIHEMLLEALKDKYLDLQLGQYYHSADSFHIYEKHWEMMENILTNNNGRDEGTFTLIDCPRINGIQEVRRLMHNFKTDEDRFNSWLHYTAK